MSRWKLGSMVNGSMGYFTDPYKWGIPWGYNPLIRSPLILTSFPGHPRNQEHAHPPNLPILPPTCPSSPQLAHPPHNLPIIIVWCFNPMFSQWQKRSRHNLHKMPETSPKFEGKTTKGHNKKIPQYC